MRLTRRKFVTSTVALGVAPLSKLAMAFGSGVNQRPSPGTSVQPEQTGLVQVHEDFSRDPGWDNIHNRIVCKDCPTVVQDFGWRPTAHVGGRPGEIGGRVWQSRTPAFYGLPLGRPLSFNDRFSASGRIAFMRTEGLGAAYLGFFNNALQGWRPWSSVAFRLVAEAGNKVRADIDYMTAKWGAFGDETDILISADGSPHTWKMSYDPEGRMAARWPDPRLRNYLSTRRQTATQIYERARQAEPGLTREELMERLRAALAEDLLRFFPRPRGDFWTLNEHKHEPTKGTINFQFDSGLEHSFHVLAEHRQSPLILNRFGIFNYQIYHRWLEFYVADLTVNGQALDLSSDPGWEGHGNRVQFVERDFQRQNFGYSETNWAGKQIGEIGGEFYRVEAVDPYNGYYADEIGALTLDDPIEFSGQVCFVSGGTDAGMFLGYFNAREKMAPITDRLGGDPLDDTLGVEIAGPTRIGYYFSAVCSPKRRVASHRHGPVFLPTADRHAFRFTYDPKDNGGVGRIRVWLDEEEFTLDLKPEQRAAGARFDHFGLMNLRRGGKYVTVYFDDLTYTARRASNYRRIRHPQKIWEVPYPQGGRTYE